MRRDIHKLVQAAGVLLKEEAGHQMSYLRLMKLLYIANRTALKECGTLVIRDRMVAMDHGPVLSKSLNVVKGLSTDSVDWDRFVEREQYKISLKSDPGISGLSRYEIDLLQRVSSAHANLDDWRLVDETHGFPEWVANYIKGTSTVISLECILQTVGRQEDAEAIVAELDADEAREELLSRAGVISTPRLRA